MGDKLFAYAGLGRVPKLALRFTNDDPSRRERRLKNDPDIKFILLPQPMTKADAAEWLRAQPHCKSDLWQAAIGDRLRRRP